MFEPENQGVNCPTCPGGKIYLDYEIGYYCMSCGRKFSIKEMLMILELKVCHINSKKYQ
jgi:DNA-directed RNA polymerase subunit RPC12/RpoP